MASYTKFFLALLLISGMLSAQIPEDEVEITASSTLAPGKVSRYSPDQIMDGKADSWCEGVDGPGVGEKISIELRYPDEMKYITLKNGFGKEQYWSANARVKKIKITDSGGNSRVLELEDTPGFKSYGLQEFQTDEYEYTSALGRLQGSSFEVEILEVYPGERWEDLCICEIMLNQWYLREFLQEESFIQKHLLMEYLDGVFGADGMLYLEDDWAGLIPAEDEAGVLKSAISSGDGTTGEKSYYAFIQGENDAFFVLESIHISNISEAGMEGKTGSDGRPERVDSFSWSISRFDPFLGSFSSLMSEGLDSLFIELPHLAISKALDKTLTLNDIHLSIEEAGILKAQYPPGADVPEIELFYLWDGNWFRQKSYSPDFP